MLSSPCSYYLQTCSYCNYILLQHKRLDHLSVIHLFYFVSVYWLVYFLIQCNAGLWWVFKQRLSWLTKPIWWSLSIEQPVNFLYHKGSSLWLLSSMSTLPSSVIKLPELLISVLIVLRVSTVSVKLWYFQCHTLDFCSETERRSKLLIWLPSNSTLGYLMGDHS